MEPHRLKSVLLKSVLLVIASSFWQRISPNVRAFLRRSRGRSGRGLGEPTRIGRRADFPWNAFVPSRNTSRHRVRRSRFRARATMRGDLPLRALYCDREKPGGRVYVRAWG